MFLHGVRRNCKTPPKQWAKGAPIWTCLFPMELSWNKFLIYRPIRWLFVFASSFLEFPLKLFLIVLSPSTHSSKVGILFRISTSAGTNASVLQHNCIIWSMFSFLNSRKHILLRFFQLGKKEEKYNKIQ